MRAMPLLPPDLAFDEAAPRLLEAARARTGLDDFGPDEFREGFGVLLESLEGDADLSPLGREICAGLLVTALAGRLEAQAALDAHPEAQALPLEAPIVIVGLPRTGTTALHKMLCCDPRLQGLELWLAQSPRPRPPRAAWPELPAFQRCDAATKAMHAAAPDMASIHEMAADEPDECWNLFRQSMASVTFECVARVTRYARWWAACDMRAAYGRWSAQLRLIGSTDPTRRWVLKDPSHLFALDVLFELHPDALVVMTHRDPVRSIPSVCSLNRAARAANDRVPDDRALGREQLALWARGVDRALAVRAAHPDRFLDVDFGRFVTDRDAVLREIQERAGLAPHAEARRRMHAWSESHPAAPHRYAAEEFGLEAGAIRERFASYLKTCDVPIEA